MKLIDVFNEIRNRTDFDELLTVYAKKNWSPDSDAIITQQPEDGRTTPIDGYEYFLEVIIVKEWVDELDSSEVTREQCNRIIKYAISDA